MKENKTSTVPPKINRLNDRFVKYIFGTERNKTLLIDFINDALCLEGEKIIDEITLNVGELVQGTHDGKSSRLDVSAKLTDGTTVDIEVQIINHHDFEKRFPFYWAMRHIIKSPAGMNYVGIKPTILICVLAFDLLDEENFRNTYSIRNDETNSRLCDDMQLIFLELPKFKKAMNRPATGLERWLFYFATEEGEENEMMEQIAQYDPAIAMARLMEREFWSNEYERELYFAEQKRIMDEISARTNYETLAKNYETIIKKKYAEGKIEGKTEGKAEGIKEGMLRVAKQMLEKGASTEDVANWTDLSREEIIDLGRG